MSEGIQITIPDIDDDDLRSGPGPFGRAGHGFGGGGGFGNSGFGGNSGAFGSGFGGSGFGGAGFGASNGLDSPGAATPLGGFQATEKSYFSHTRGDSSASVDSESSATVGFTRKPSMPFGHTPQPSTGGGFTKKPSFASIRNAFKSGKSANAEPPPVPFLEQTPYPVLKNPFNRSTSSLNHANNGRVMAGTPIGVGTSQPRPPTPGSNEIRLPRGLSFKSKSHGYSKSSGSVLQTSDGSDYGQSFVASPPPVPRVPTAFGHMHQNDVNATLDVDDDKIVMDPKTPADFALHAVFIRFAQSAEEKIETFLRQPLEPDPLLTNVMGKGVDVKLDDTLRSLGIIGQKQAKKVIDCILRWRKTQTEAVSDAIVQAQAATASPAREADVRNVLDGRKDLASIHIMCRALIAVLEGLTRDVLGNDSHHLESTIFKEFRNPAPKLLAQSANHRVNQELYATLLGHLSNIRFMDVTLPFTKELKPMAMGQVPKDLGLRYEHLVQGLKHIKIKVYPMEAFEEGAEFMEDIAKAYQNAHGVPLKIAFTQSLMSLLHPIGKTAQAEINHPQWKQAMEMIFPKAQSMINKPRYWAYAFPLAITSLCVAPHTFFLKNWQSCFDFALARLKDRDKQYRAVYMNGILRLLWTYLNRSTEPPSTTSTKLENCLKSFFPANKATIFPLDDHYEVLTCIVHFILARQPEYGREILLDLLQESTTTNSQKSNNTNSYIAPERTSIAINALLMSLNLIEREVLTPSWPSNSDFTVLPTKEDYPTSSSYLQPASLKPGMLDLVNRCSASLAVVANVCSSAVGRMSVFDDQWSSVRINPNYDESNNYIFRHHPGGINVAYPAHLTPHISLLQTSFQAWPRCLHSSISISDAIDMLLWGVIHVEPGVAEAASSALHRFMEDEANAVVVVSSFNRFLFNPSHICQDSNFKLQAEFAPLLSLWQDLVDEWIHKIVHRGVHTYPFVQQILSTCSELEATSVILLSAIKSNLHDAGVKLARALGLVNDELVERNGGSPPLPIVARLLHKDPAHSCLTGFDDLIDKADLVRLEYWRKHQPDDVHLQIADSANDKDRSLWRLVLPTLLKGCLTTASLANAREGIVAAVTRYHPCISYLAGLSNRIPPGLHVKNSPDRDVYKLLSDNKPLIAQWHVWVTLLCCTAIPPDASRPAYTQLGRDHARAPSDSSFEKERLSTTRGLFRYLTPFLDSEYSLFRDAAVLCISSFPPNAYPQLLEDLSLLAGRQFYDDSRGRIATTPAYEPAGDRQRNGSAALLFDRNRRQERLHTAVARIYCLTAHLLDAQRSSARQAALSNILKFVRHTQTFLSSPDNRDNPTFNRLRRYFCGTVERLFDGLATLEGSDRFIPPHIHLTLYRLCEDWCRLGPQSEAAKKRQANMQRIVESYEGDQQDNISHFQRELAALSHAAVGALASLCHHAVFPPEQSTGSPTERLAPEFMRPLVISSVLDRLSHIMTSAYPENVGKGKATLKSLLMSFELSNEHLQDTLRRELSQDGSRRDDAQHRELVHETLRRSIIITEKLESANQRFFEVVADIVMNERHQLPFASIVCLGLTNLRHPSSATRCLAFGMLEAIHQKYGGLLTMSNFEPTVGSLASTTYIHAHRLVSDFLAGEHPDEAVDILVQLGNWLPQLPGEAYDTNVILLLLQALEAWLPNINLMTDDKSSVSKKGLHCLYHLTALTLRYGQSHAEQVLVLWTRLVDPPQQSNGHAAARFLLEQAHKVGNTLFVTCASNIIASLCQTHIARAVLEELCSVIEPLHMLPTYDHKLSFPEAQDMKLWEDLDALFAEHPRLSLGTAQFAWLFVADVALQRYWEMTDQLPILLHSVFMHIDHRNPFIRQRAHALLFQLLRGWLPGYDELPDRSKNRGRAAMKESLAMFEREAQEMYWADEDPSTVAVPKMNALCSRVLSYLDTLAPFVVGQWGSLALTWATSCSVRAIAFRSLQIFQALMPRVKKADFALLLGRLSNTIAAPEENLQSFTTEIFSTINAVAEFNDLNKTILPQVFWCACAGLATTVESEFIQVLKLLQCILTKVDLEDPTTVEQLLSQRPNNWRGSPYLQPALLKGLRSSVTFAPTMQVLQRLAKIKDGQLIDDTSDRLRDLYTAALPSCLNAMDNPSQAAPIKAFADDIAALAGAEDRKSIQKIMNSFSKGHFRTRDDFLRQSVSSLREHYGAQYWPNMVTLLLGLILNTERWLRVNTMQIIKVLFQQRQSRNPSDHLGSEVLMPLLRLLETDLAPEALDVLDEPIVMSGGGSAAKQVIRMSMHFGGALPMLSDGDGATRTFGVPEESGWCVAQTAQAREICRANVMAVFDTCSVPTRPSRIDFEPEAEGLAAIRSRTAGADDEDDLSGLVKNLHELTTFFEPGATTSAPTRRLEARVAAILAKSSAPDSVSDTPQTPFLDVFRISGVDHFHDSDEYSDSDSDADAFIFDSVSTPVPRSAHEVRYH